MTNEVYLTRTAAFLPNAPVANDQMEAVLGMAGGIPSRVRRMILRANSPPKPCACCSPPRPKPAKPPALPAPRPTPTKPCRGTA